VKASTMAILIPSVGVLGLVVGCFTYSHVVQRA
jgi:hypothetical protein